MHINVIFIKRIIIFIYVFKIKFTCSPRYILVYYFGKVTVAGGVIMIMSLDMRYWHVTFLRYEAQFKVRSAIAKYLRKLFPYVSSCTNLIMPQNRPRTYRRIRKWNYFSLLEHENELNCWRQSTSPVSLRTWSIVQAVQLLKKKKKKEKEDITK